MSLADAHFRIESQTLSLLIRVLLLLKHLTDADQHYHTMALQLLPIHDVKEVPALACLHLDAMMLVRVNQAMYPRGQTPPVIAATESRHLNNLQNDPTARYLKVFDTELNKTIAFAEWHLFSTPLEESSRQDLEPRTWSEGMNVPLATEFWAHIIAARKSMAGISHVFLSLIVTDPGQGRRGAASMLMEWGVRLADEKGLPSFLESTPHGKGLYAKFGFVEKEEFNFEVDLDGKGGEGEMYKHLVMVRPARSKYS